MSVSAGIVHFSEPNSCGTWTKFQNREMRVDSKEQTVVYLLIRPLVNASAVEWGRAMRAKAEERRGRYSILVYAIKKPRRRILKHKKRTAFFWSSKGDGSGSPEYICARQQSEVRLHG
jgi:hypothetical protein